MEFMGLTDDDVILQLSRAGALAETKRKRPCAALQLHRGVYFFHQLSQPAGICTALVIKKALVWLPIVAAVTGP